MNKSNRAGAETGFPRELASAVADAVAEGIETGAFELHVEPVEVALP